MDALNEDLQNQGINNVVIIVIGKEQHNDDNPNWTEGNSIPVVTSSNTLWSTWGASQWDLFFLDENGEYVTDFNINPWIYNDVYNQIHFMIENTSTLYTQSYPKQNSLFFF